MKRTKYILDFTEEFEKDVQDELNLKQKKNSELTTRTYMKIVRTMLHGQLKDSSRPNDSNKKGVVIAFPDKQSMSTKRAEIVTSLQQLVKIQPTHFSQGSYPKYKLYTDKKGVVSGFQKDNLNQINFCLIDVDSKKKGVNELVDCAHANGLRPSLVIESDRGYQIYFIFQEALYLNGKKFKWILNAAEKVNENIKKIYQKSGFDVDVGCTTFQICRFPQKERIRFYDIGNLMSFDEYAKWSLRQTEYNRLPRKNGQSNNNGNFTLVKGNLPGWTRALRGFSGFKEGDRNTCLYTVSLSYRDSGIPYEQAIEELTPWMTGQGLKKSDVKRTIQSAYKSDKHARKDFFEPLLQEYGLQADHVSQIDWSRFSEKQLKRYWALRKPAKNREDRKYSHFSERMDDLMALLEKNNGSITSSKKDLMASLKIGDNSRNTLNIILKKLEQAGRITIEKEGTSRRAKLIIKIVNEVKKPETSETVMAVVPEERKEEYTKQNLREDVARSLVGPPKGREFARVRAVQAVGTKQYGSLVNAFIIDPEAFLGSSEDLERIRGTG